MPAFIPITIYLNCKPMVVASISDAAKALEQPWPYVAKPRRLEAVRMIKECLAGHCNQQAAIDAFKAAAIEQGLFTQTPPSVGLTKFDGFLEIWCEPILLSPSGPLAGFAGHRYADRFRGVGILLRMRQRSTAVRFHMARSKPGDLNMAWKSFREVGEKMHSTEYDRPL